jgi:hypothetical protein
MAEMSRGYFLLRTVSVFSVRMVAPLARCRRYFAGKRQKMLISGGERAVTDSAARGRAIRSNGSGPPAGGLEPRVALCENYVQALDTEEKLARLNPGPLHDAVVARLDKARVDLAALRRALGIPE